MRKYCWGDNESGQLGELSTQTRPRPTPIAMPSNVSAISAGDRFTCAVSGSAPYCWGTDANGQLGDGGGSADQLTPLLIASVNTASGITAGRYHVCVTRNAMTVMCWGANANGEIGNNRVQPTEKPDAIASVTIDDVAAGSQHTCGRAGATPYCWGNNSHGELGDGTTSDRRLPTMISLPGSNPVLESGYTHSCAVTSTGMYCWGDNTLGQLGDGTTVQRRAPTKVPGVEVNARIAAGDNFTCAIDAGTVYCWGDNTRGQLGLGTLSRSLTAIEVTFP
jgi:alpha-tubulin suppressor-like RCC1 family protein